jgi:hypothetical protein
MLFTEPIRYRQSLDEQLPDAPRTVGELEE